MDATLSPPPPASASDTPSTAGAERQPDDGATLLRVRGLELAVPGRTLLRDMNFEVRRGEALAIIGGSGGGKSTLLRCLIGLHPPAAGTVCFGSRDLYASDDATVAALRREFGVMFQAGALWSSMTVGENVMLPLQLIGTLDAEACEQQARFKLALVGLADAFDVEPAALSGGMRKRAAIARAMALDPPLLFLDEPSAGLDPLTAARLDELIVHLCRDLGTTVIVVTHDLDSIFAVADRALFIDAATQTMAALGPPADLREHGPDVVREFLTRGAAATALDGRGTP
jgi:phospholipid/cholesterol/gamma-HCH transport system ATP-binding protein